MKINHLATRHKIFLNSHGRPAPLFSTPIPLRPNPDLNPSPAPPPAPTPTKPLPQTLPPIPHATTPPKTLLFQPQPPAPLSPQPRFYLSHKTRTPPQLLTQNLHPSLTPISSMWLRLCKKNPAVWHEHYLHYAGKIRQRAVKWLVRICC